MDVLSGRLQYFVRCAVSPSFQAAARELGLTQGALSIAIRKLEDDLGAPLFDRHPRGISLTRKGEALFDRLQHLQSEAASAIEHAISETDDLPLRIGAVSHFGVKYLLPLLKRDDWHSLRHHIFFGSSLTVYEAVKSRRLDYGIISWTHKPKDVRWLHIKEDPVALVGLKKRFPKLSKVKSLDDIPDLPWVHVPKPQREFADFFEPKRNCFIVHHSHAFKAVILSGNAVGPAQLDQFTKDELNRLAIAKVPLPKWEVDIYLVIRTDAPTTVRDRAENLAKLLRAKS